MKNEEAINKLIAMKKYHYPSDQMAIDRGINAIRKGMPMTHDHGRCPLCDEKLTKNANYCAICGQKIDWGQDENT